MARGCAFGTDLLDLVLHLGLDIGSLPIRLVLLGVGALLWRCRFGEPRFEVRLRPYSGFVSPYPVVNSRWYCWVLFLLGGVLGNVAVIFPLAGLDALGPPPGAAGRTFWATLFSPLFLLFLNLLPFPAHLSRPPHPH